MPTRLQMIQQPQLQENCSYPHFRQPLPQSRRQMPISVGLRLAQRRPAWFCHCHFSAQPQARENVLPLLLPLLPPLPPPMVQKSLRQAA